MNLAKALDTNALRRPDLPAVITNAISISHADFRDMVCRRATYLSSRGISRDDIVGVNLKDNPNISLCYLLSRE